MITYTNLSVVSEEDFKVSISSEDSLREDEVEIEQGSAVSRPLCGKRKNIFSELGQRASQRAMAASHVIHDCEPCQSTCELHSY